MIKKPIVAANWKMFKTPQEGVHFISELNNLLLDKEKPSIIFCPPFTSLFHMNEMISIALAQINPTVGDIEGNSIK